MNDQPTCPKHGHGMRHVANVEGGSWWECPSCLPLYKVVKE